MQDNVSVWYYVAARKLCVVVDSQVMIGLVRCLTKIVI